MGLTTDQTATMSMLSNKSNKQTAWWARAEQTQIKAYSVFNRVTSKVRSVIGSTKQLGHT
jgi:hypothetical protein